MAARPMPSDALAEPAAETAALRERPREACDVPGRARRAPQPRHLAVVRAERGRDLGVGGARPSVSASAASAPRTRASRRRVPCGMRIGPAAAAGTARPMQWRTQYRACRREGEPARRLEALGRAQQADRVPLLHAVRVPEPARAAAGRAARRPHSRAIAPTQPGCSFPSTGRARARTRARARAQHGHRDAERGRPLGGASARPSAASTAPARREQRRKVAHRGDARRRLAQPLGAARAW